MTSLELPVIASTASSMPGTGSSSNREAAALYLFSESVDYDKEKRMIVSFLSKYPTLDGQGFKYKTGIEEIAELSEATLTIDLEDVKDACENPMHGLKDEMDADLVDRIQDNAKIYLQLFYEAVDEILPPLGARNAKRSDANSMFMAHRLARLGITPSSTNEEVRSRFPPALLRNYDIILRPLKNTPQKTVREVRAEDIGHLVCVRGIVTRISEVSPKIIVNTYTCEQCNNEIFEEITTSTFTPKPECNSIECKERNSKGKLSMQTRGSKFVKFQEFKLQEMADQVPMGHTPRTMTCNVEGELCRSVTAGDVVEISGIYLPKPYTGFQAIRAGLLTDTYLQVTHVHQLRQSYTAVEWSDLDLDTVRDLARDPHAYERLAQSIAPEIYGHVDVKKALLLLMVGGVTRALADGMKIRGDINICLMGDPGTAKSQLLKYISKVAPRGVYTTGKGSSGVGLTAAVVKDPVTSALVLEGGALVMADNGICCIDEFDKMEEADRTAIHEVMEQQTISISKAGISTTLNARTSLLAAANPMYSRYNVKKSVRENINLPYALLSRFDILFLILDRPAMDEDTRLAMHVTHVHRNLAAPKPSQAIIDPKLLKLYIAKAREFNPVIPESLVDSIAATYAGMRATSSFENGNKGTSNLGPSTYTTARSLLAILRLSQALAKIRFSNLVNQGDVDEALRLIDSAQSSLLLGGGNGGNGGNGIGNRNNVNSTANVTAKIFSLLREWNQREFIVSDVVQRLKAHGYTEEQFEAASRTLCDSNVWQISDSKLYIV